ncbi:MAG: murein biosynthesis integral membrane protein MurJ [Candidatus Omnitrophica bacterium]|nr:murein biosynthesis integral membrane protein MurJ [Candidatus Omnitrophota bacterium]
MKSKLIRHTTIVGGGTLISRVLGFVRDVLIARFFGTSALLESFLVAFRLPNIFRSILGEGFSDSVAVPVLAELRSDRKRFFATSAHLFMVFSLLLLAVTIAGIFASKYLVMVIAPGFVPQPEKFWYAVAFTRITFLYLFLIGTATLSGAMLYALKKFFVPAVSPALLNLVFIGGIVLFSRSLETSVLVLCVTVGGVLQSVFPYYILRREGLVPVFDLRAAWNDRVVRRMLRLFPPRVWSSIVYHLSVFIDTVFASLTPIVGAGALAAVYYANRLVQFPLALIVLSLSRVAIVDLSAYHAEGNMEEFKKVCVFSAQSIVLLIVPAAVYFCLLPGSIIKVVFQRGAFGSDSAAVTSSVLFFYSFGLVFFSFIKLLVNAFYALKDTLTPAKTSSLALVVNAVLSGMLMFPFKIGGVALGSSIAAAVNCCLLYAALRRRVGPFPWQGSFGMALKVVVLSVVCAGVSRAFWESVPLSLSLRAGGIIMISAVLFLGGGAALRIPQIIHIGKWLGRKLRHN